jgi:hypothetical protein
MGKMARLWRQCTVLGIYVLPESIVCSLLGPDGARGLVESDLGEQVPGGFRIKGTKGRIEWLRKLRKNAQKGGIAKAAKRQSGAKQEPSKPLAPPCPPALATSPALASAETTTQAEIPESEGEGRAPRSPAKRKTQLPADFVPDASKLDRKFSYESEAQRFRDHHQARGSTMADWSAAWRTWCHNALRFSKPNGANGGANPTGVAMRELDRLIEEERLRR